MHKILYAHYLLLLFLWLVEFFFCTQFSCKLRGKSGTFISGCTFYLNSNNKLREGVREKSFSVKPVIRILLMLVSGHRFLIKGKFYHSRNPQCCTISGVLRQSKIELINFHIRIPFKENTSIYVHNNPFFTLFLLILTACKSAWKFTCATRFQVV